jgi:hypothetical protein
MTAPFSGEFVVRNIRCRPLTMRSLICSTCEIVLDLAHTSTRYGYTIGRVDTPLSIRLIVNCGLKNDFTCFRIIILDDRWNIHAADAMFAQWPWTDEIGGQ